MPGRKNKQTDTAANKKSSTGNGEDGKKARVVFQLNRVTKNWSGEHGFELTVPELIIRPVSYTHLTLPTTPYV